MQQKPVRTMTVTEFDTFVGIDWTGAKGKTHSGLAVAVCRAGHEAPELVSPPSGQAHWSRREIAAWLTDHLGLGQSGRALVGIDAAFGYPYDPLKGYLRGDCAAESIFDLWSEIAEACEGSEDLFGGAFADKYARHYRMQRYNKETKRFDTIVDNDFFEPALRVTETICIREKYGPCESVLNLIGASQVGKSALSTMNMLHRLREVDEVAVWPFQEVNDQPVVMVEIYAALFSKLGGGKGKVRALDTLNARLLGLRSDAYSADLPTGSKLDDVTDALMTAAGLRRIAHDPKYWNPDALSAMVRRTEGWIFGVA